MKRDMDLIRKLALYIEAIDQEARTDIQIEGFHHDAVTYHLNLMFEHGLIKGEGLGMIVPGLNEIAIQRLTWQGHEFIDAARNEQIWNAVNVHVRSTAKSLTFDGLKAVLTRAGIEVAAYGIKWLAKTNWEWVHDVANMIGK